MSCILTFNVSQNFGSAMRMTSQLMLCGEIITVCAQIYIKHINTLCGQNVELYINTQSIPHSKHTPSLL